MKKDYSQNIFYELSDRAFSRWEDFSTSFLNIAEIAEFNKLKNNFKSNYLLTGGIDNAERKIAIFSMLEPEYIQVQDFLSYIMVTPKDEKFAENNSHRNYLGALMNLGITRDSIGDIFVTGKTAYIICLKKIDGYIKDNLIGVGRTSVKCEILDYPPPDLKIRLKEIKISSVSDRCDIIISKLYSISRKESLNLFENKSVYVNDKLVENNSYILKNGDVVSVSGYGRFIFNGAEMQTKSGNFVYNIKKYV